MRLAPNWTDVWDIRPTCPDSGLVYLSGRASRSAAGLEPGRKKEFVDLGRHDAYADGQRREQDAPDPPIAAPHQPQQGAGPQVEERLGQLHAAEELPGRQPGRGEDLVAVGPPRLVGLDDVRGSVARPAAVQWWGVR